MEVTRLDKAWAMVCFGRMVAIVEKDPDPTAQEKLQKENNCANCDTKVFCDRLADTLA